MRRQDFKLIANLISGRVGVYFVESYFSSVWKADVEKKIIYYPSTILYNEEDLGCLIHEAGHIRFSTVPVNSQKLEALSQTWKKPAQQIWYLINALEDIRIETKMKDTYPGAKKYLDKLNQNSIIRTESTVKDLQLLHPKRFQELKSHRWSQYLSYCIAEKTIGKIYSDKIYNIWEFDKDKQILEAIDKTMEPIDRIIKSQTTEEAYEIMEKEILKYYLPLCDDVNQISDIQKFLDELTKALKDLLDKEKEELEKKRSKGKTKKSQSKKEKGDGNGGNEEDEDDEDSDDEDDGDGDEAEAMNLQTKKDDEMKNLGIPKKVKVKVPNVGRNLDDQETVPRINTADDLKREVEKNLATTRKAISILKDIQTIRYEGNYESGKLTPKKLYKLYTGNTKIFSKKVVQDKDQKDFVFAILVDNSGSMSDICKSGRRKSEEACVSAATLGKSLELANKRFAVYRFNDFVKEVKGFNKKMKYEDMMNLSYDDGGTDDVKAINHVMEILNKQPEKNKILIVATDGETYINESQKCVSEAEKTATVYGIGIRSRGLKDVYSKYINIEDASDLGAEFGKILQKTVGKRIR